LLFSARDDRRVRVSVAGCPENSSCIFINHGPARISNRPLVYRLDRELKPFTTVGLLSKFRVFEPLQRQKPRIVVLI
jgi:hypothetical protein